MKKSSESPKTMVAQPIPPGPPVQKSRRPPRPKNTGKKNKDRISPPGTSPFADYIWTH